MERYGVRSPVPSSVQFLQCVLSICSTVLTSGPISASLRLPACHHAVFVLATVLLLLAFPFPPYSEALSNSLQHSLPLSLCFCVSCQISVFAQSRWPHSQLENLSQHEIVLSFSKLCYCGLLEAHLTGAWQTSLNSMCEPIYFSFFYLFFLLLRETFFSTSHAATAGFVVLAKPKMARL